MDAIREQLAARVAELEGQRDQLREALENIMLWWDGVDEIHGQFIEARAALKATEEDV